MLAYVPRNDDQRFLKIIYVKPFARIWSCVLGHKEKIIPEHHHYQSTIYATLPDATADYDTYCITTDSLRQVCFVCTCMYVSLWSWDNHLQPACFLIHTTVTIIDIHVLRISQTQSNLCPTAYLPDGSISNIILWLVETFLCSIANICPGFLMSQTNNSLSCMRHK